MEHLGTGEVVYWDLFTSAHFSVTFAPGSYVAWAKGTYFQDRPDAPVDSTGGVASLLFGDPPQTLDSCAIDLGPIRPDAP